MLALGLAALAPGAHSSESASLIGRHVLQTRGIWVSFERPGSPTGWSSGELLDAIGSASVRGEVVRQLKLMRAMGANEIVFEMRSADGPWPVSSAYPDCERATTLGPRWPDPTVVELSGLRTLLDLVHAQRMRISLILNSTHMEESPPSGNARWLSAILGAVKDKPALDLVMFGGDRRRVDAVAPLDGAPDSCGGESEAPLWLGPDSVEAKYVEWAIGHARSLGVPPVKLTAEAIVGDYRQEVRQGASSAATDGHLWPTLEVLRTIFDRLGFPASQRTYAISYYPHVKCAFVDTTWVPCTEQEQHAWSDETLRVSRERVGPLARLFVAEFGTQSSSWSHEATVEGLGALLGKHRVEGAVYWQWVNPSNDPRYTHPGTDLKLRGRSAYSPQQRELADLFGFHLRSILNGSFEAGRTRWRLVGTGRATQLDLSNDASLAPLSWRGRYALRLRPRGKVAITSPPIRVSPRTTYTTTANLRFRRGGASLAFTFLTCKRALTSTFVVYSVLGTTDGFDTFPVTYTTPKATCYVRIEIGSTRSATLDIDYVR
jgi:hypothetical protein